MPDEALEAMADLLGALAHPDRLQLLVLLHRAELDVAHLAQAMALSQPRTSQHLALLRAHHLVASRREGRRAVYHLTQPDLVPWLLQAAAFLEEDAARQTALAQALSRVMTGLETG